MPPGIVVLFILILLSFFIYQAFYSQRARVRRKIRNTAAIPVSDFKNGETGKVTGEIYYGGKVLKAPLSGRHCVYYHVVVEERHHSGKSSHWHTIINAEQAGDVIIKNGNHFAAIDTELVLSYVVKDVEMNSGFLNDAGPVLKKYLARFGCESEGLLGFNKTIRYSEGILEQGESIAATGVGSWHAKSNLKLKLPAEKVLVISGNNSEPVHLSDDPSLTG